MKMILSVTTALGLAFLPAGRPATRGDDGGAKQDAQPSRAQAERKDAPRRDGSGEHPSGREEPGERGSGELQGRVEKIRGELAGATIVGETMVDHRTGRGVVAELTYLTILGSPAEPSAEGEAHGEAEEPDEKRRERGGATRRKVYQIAVGPETQVGSAGSQGGPRSGSRKDDQEESPREKSQADLRRLELGDRVEVEFVRLDAQESARDGGAARASSDLTRHGRHRIIRGAARSLSILDAPGHGERPGKEAPGEQAGRDD